LCVRLLGFIVTPSLHRPEYVVRTINDSGALECGVSSELPAMLGAHPLEDVMHLGSWIQLYTILHSGCKPETFQCFPDYNGRPPELVRGWTYPLLGLDPDNMGTICLCPEGKGDAARITIGNAGDSSTWRVEPYFDLRLWFEQVKRLKMMVAPLVFRHYAVFRNPSRNEPHPMVAVDFIPDQPFPVPNANDFHADAGDPIPVPRQFIDHRGMYDLADGPGSTTKVPFMEAHDLLLPIGTFILVETASIQQFGLGSPKRWIRGSLRYPDEEIEPNAGNDAQLRVYVTIRIRTRVGEEQEMKVVYAPPRSCRVFADARATEGEYSVDAIRQLIRIHAGGAGAV
jgi:hypothetical protein